jgi:predicted lipoprotein with Yx(FWY)xxD motif
MPIKLMAAVAAALFLSVAAGPGAAGEAATRVTAKASRYGKVLFDGRGYSLYLFAADRGRRSTCYGACAAAWPPFLAKGRPIAGLGIKPRLLGTTHRRDGKRQVTYGGHPLYYYVHDGRGEIKCHNVSEFGGLWLVVRPDGKAVR